MRRLLLLPFAWSCLSVLAFAQSPQSRVQVTAVSAYTWRGRVLNQEPCLQPGVSLQWADASLDLWSTWDLTGEPGSASRERVDVTFAYGTRLDNFHAGIGVTGYFYLHDDPVAPADTVEAFLVYGLDVLLAPTLMVSYDFFEADGVYAEASLAHSFEFSERVALDCRLLLGWADEEYARSQFTLPADAGRGFAGFMPADALLAELKVEALLPIRVGNRIELQPGIAYMTSLDPDRRDALAAAGEAGDRVVVSLGLEASF